LFFPVLGLSLALAACTVDSPDVFDESVGAVAVSGGGVTVDMQPICAWSGGFTGLIDITDTAFASPISTFEIVFKLGGHVGVGAPFILGNVTTADASGNYTATNPDWMASAPIQVGETRYVGFTGTGTFTDYTIVSVKLNGTTVPIGTGG
jgi:hypothetical protein